MFLYLSSESWASGRLGVCLSELIALSCLEHFLLSHPEIQWLEESLRYMTFFIYVSQSWLSSFLSRKPTQAWGIAEYLASISVEEGRRDLGRTSST